MALSLICLNATKQRGLHSIIRLTSNHFSTLTLRKLPVTSLLQQKFEARNISLTAPRLSAGADHSVVWKLERGLSVALLGLIPAAIISPNAVLDNLLAVSLVVHMHWGIEANVVDYIRPIIFGNVIPKMAMGVLYLVSFATLGGLLYFNYNDVGIGQAVRKLWALKAK